MVKQYPDGKQSTHLHSLKPGDSLLFAAALGGHAWKPDPAHRPHVTLIAGGAGITPVYQLARGILSNPQDPTKVTLVYGINSDDDFLLKDEFASWKSAHGDRFNLVVANSRPTENSPSAWKKGRITKELLREIGITAEHENATRDDKVKRVFICGPPAMEQSLLGLKKEKGILEQLGYSKSELHNF